MAKRRTEYIYGINPVFEVLRGKRRTIHQVYLSTSSSGNPRLKKLCNQLERNEIPVEWVDKGRVIDLSGTRENQGVVAKATVYPYCSFEALLESNRLLLLDNVEDPHNVGAILRSAEIFGFHHVLLPSKGVPEIYPSVLKVSAGATEFLNIARESSSNTYVRKAAESGFKILALDRGGESTMEQVAPGEEDKILLVVGGEDKAVGQFILNMADHVIGIHQRGKVNSLNASVAAGIAMYALGPRGSHLGKD